MPSCELSPSASAFSSMLSAFIGSVLNGLFSGFWIAFFTGWISWLSVIRILVAGLYECYLSAKAGTDYEAVETKQYQSMGMAEYGRGAKTAGDTSYQGAAQDDQARIAHDMDTVQQHLITQGDPRLAAQYEMEKKTWAGRFLSSKFRNPERSVSAFGWLGWIWSGIYTPISQTIWFAVHIPRNESTLLFVRALAIGVSALGLTFDYKQRYGAALAKRWGSWAFVVFNWWNAVACTLLGVEALVLLIKGAITAEHFPIPLFVIYPIFSCFWAWISWKILPPIDGGRPGIAWWADILMGAFAGLFVAAPAFALWQNANFDARVAKMMGSSRSGGLDLGEFLECQGASVLEKFAAIMP